MNHPAPLSADDRVRVIRESFQLEYAYPIFFAERVLAPDCRVLDDAVAPAGPGPHRLLVVIDSGIVDARPDFPAQVRTFLDARDAHFDCVAPPLVVPGGERCKQDYATVERLHQAIARYGLCRHSFVLAIGGGAVLDAVGFATATAHRGLRLLRMPSTVLAQNDAGIGVKNAINLGSRKNFIGTFAPPYAVINDYSLLATLPGRDARAGLAEAVKVALLKDAPFFEWLYGRRELLAEFDPDAMREMIYRCARLHAQHIARSGDPFEQGSARPLDFGHWAAHHLEELSGYRLRHGEAVAIGIALDVLYCQAQGWLSRDEASRVVELVRALGFDLAHDALRALDVDAALESFRQHLGGDPSITLLQGIGQGRQVGDLDHALMARCRETLLRKF